MEVAMIEEILSYTSKYKAANKKQSRKLKGQFFTSPRTALYMAQTVAYKADHLSILDPGCGNLILAASTIEYSMVIYIAQYVDFDFFVLMFWKF